MSENNLAMISFDGVHLLLPQDGVATVDTASKVVPAASNDGAIGTLSAAGSEWPVYALAADFKPRAECPPDYKYCIAIKGIDGFGFSLACEQVGSVAVDDETELQPLQACMRAAGNPIEALLLKDGKLMMVSDAAAMSRFLFPEAAA